MSQYGGPNLGGGPVNGYSPTQTITNFKDSESVAARRILRDSWNSKSVAGKVNNYSRLTTPFRAVGNSGDYLARMNYSCGGPNPQGVSKPGYGRLIGSIPQHCDSTNIPASSCNTKFVADSSDYIRFRKLRAVNQTYNDLGFGGSNRGSYVPLMAIRRR
jgi:hypothetical protein